MRAQVSKTSLPTPPGFTRPPKQALCRCNSTRRRPSLVAPSRQRRVGRDALAAEAGPRTSSWHTSRCRIGNKSKLLIRSRSGLTPTPSTTKKLSQDQVERHCDATVGSWLRRCPLPSWPKAARSSGTALCRLQHPPHFPLQPTPRAFMAKQPSPGPRSGEGNHIDRAARHESELTGVSHGRPGLTFLSRITIDPLRSNVTALRKHCLGAVPGASLFFHAEYS